MEKIFFVIIGVILFVSCICNSVDNEENEESENLFDRVYKDGSWRTKDPWGSGYRYSDGRKSWVDICGREHRSDGEVVDRNGYVYDKDGIEIAEEYTDIFGVTRRRDRR